MKVSCLVVLTALLVLCKLCGVIDATWLFVLVPLWAPIAASIAVFAVAVMLALILTLARL